MARSMSLAAALAVVSSVAFAQVGPGSVQIGGFGNSAPGTLAVEVGGFGNAAGDFSGVLGGVFNQANTYSGISGGYANGASVASFIGGGVQNQATGFSAVGGGVNNKATGVGSFVGGGAQNTASAVGSAVVGGSNNTASGDYSAVLSGRSASATASGAVTIADNNTTAANSNANSLLLSFAGGVYTSATLKQSWVSVNVTRTAVVNGGGNAAQPASADLVLPEGGNLFRLVNSGIDITNTANNFAAANITQNQTVVIERVTPVLTAGTKITLLVDDTGTPTAGGTQRQSFVFFRDSVMGDGTKNPAATVNGNLQLGFSQVGLATTEAQPTTVTNLGAIPINFNADDDDTLTLVSDGTRWVEVARSSN